MAITNPTGDQRATTLPPLTKEASNTPGWFAKPQGTTPATPLSPDCINEIVANLRAVCDAAGVSYNTPNASHLLNAIVALALPHELLWSGSKNNTGVQALNTGKTFAGKTWLMFIGRRSQTFASTFRNTLIIPASLFGNTNDTQVGLNDSVYHMSIRKESDTSFRVQDVATYAITHIYAL